LIAATAALFIGESLSPLGIAALLLVSAADIQSAQCGPGHSGVF